MFTPSGLFAYITQHSSRRITLCRRPTFILHGVCVCVFMYYAMWYIPSGRKGGGEVEVHCRRLGDGSGGIGGHAVREAFKSACAYINNVRRDLSDPTVTRGRIWAA